MPDEFPPAELDDAVLDAIWDRAGQDTPPPPEAVPEKGAD